jgi:hypothetical protein
MEMRTLITCGAPLFAAGSCSRKGRFGWFNQQLWDVLDTHWLGYAESKSLRWVDPNHRRAQPRYNPGFATQSVSRARLHQCRDIRMALGGTYEPAALPWPRDRITWGYESGAGPAAGGLTHHDV